MIKVLYVEPEEFSQVLARASRVNNTCNIDLEVASNASDALSKLKTDDFECILLGHSPPLLDGVELTKKIREISNIPIVFYSAPDYNLIKNALDAGANDFIIKTGEVAPISVIEKRINLVTNVSNRSVLQNFLKNWLPRIIKARNVDQLAASTLNIAEEFFDFDISTFFIVEKDNLLLVETRLKKDRVKIDVNDVLPVARAVRNKSPVQVEYKNIEEINIFKGLKSELAMPIKSDGIIVAVLNFYSFTKRTYTEDEVEELNGFADFVGFVYEYINESSKRDFRRDYQDKILGSINDAVYVIESDKFIYVNRKGAEILGYPEPTDVIGSYAYKFVAPENQEFVRRISTIIDSPLVSPEKYTLKLLRRDGFVIDTEAVASKVMYDGMPAYLIVCRGVSEWKGRDEEFIKYTEGLKNLIDKKTQELFEAERMAAAGKLASMVGHDLRSPLQSIRNAAYVMRKHPDRLTEMLDLIDESVDRSLVMLEELRQKTRDTPLDTHEIDLSSFISKILKETPIPESVKVRTKLDSAIQLVEIDPIKVRRVLDNLIRNAVEAMNAVGRLSIITTDLGENFQIKVSDTGVGIPTDKIQYLFKPFYTTKEKGLGLGLAYSQKAIEAHGGRIDVVSKEGEGTTFIMTIPKRLPSKNNKKVSIGTT